MLPRWKPEMNTIYRAETLGHLSISFPGGRTGRVDVLVGEADPPTELAGTFYASDIGASLGLIIRPGEFWMMATRTSHAGRAKVSTNRVFTPFV